MTASEVLAWLNLEQRKAERWDCATAGAYRFRLTGPELMLVRNALESLTSPPAPSGWQPQNVYMVGWRDGWTAAKSSEMAVPSIGDALKWWETCPLKDAPTQEPTS